VLLQRPVLGIVLEDLEVQGRQRVAATDVEQLVDQILRRVQLLGVERACHARDRGLGNDIPLHGGAEPGSERPVVGLSVALAPTLHHACDGGRR